MNSDLALMLFAGFFAAMCAVNVIAAIVMRSLPSAMYAALMAVMVVLTRLNVGGTFGGLLHAVLIAAYMACTVAFAFALLQVWRNDRRAAWITAVVLAVNVVLVFAEDLFGNDGVLGQGWARFYAVDQVAFDLLLVLLIVVGVRALRRDGLVAGSYLVAFLLPAIGAVLNDLSLHHVLPYLEPILASFYVGMMWEATLLSFAVSLRNHQVQTERDRFERLAYIDGLTGVANRRTFDEELERLWTIARRMQMPIAIAMIDIDFFKRYNDAQGHQRGDDCLRRVAIACAATLHRANDTFARYGGEEFAAILYDTDDENAKILGERMREAVAAGGDVTISVGACATVPRKDERPEGLLGRADKALYRAKESGRNCVVCDPEFVRSGVTP
jgi:diguanylate cyclase (GGDEF)-like protein